MADWFYPRPQEIIPEVFSTLPPKFRQLQPSEHGTNQKRGRFLDSFLEGPVVVDNTLYLADIPFGRIFSLDLTTKQWRLLHQYDGEPNGLAWHPQRQQLGIADCKQGILALDQASRKLETIMPRFNGERLKGPNDLVVARDSTIISTDQGMSGLQDPTGRVFRLASGGRVDVLLRNRPSPNGPILNERQDSLFVAMTRDNSVWLLPLYPNGSVQRTGRFFRYFGTGGPDGMVTDTEGNVFVAHSSRGRCLSIARTELRWPGFRQLLRAKDAQI
jgi:gluconolactonase